jgi:Tol biopolymer transport system component
MSVDARIRKGLTMIEKELPGVDTLEEYENLERDIRHGDRRRRALIGAAAAVVVAAAASAVLLNQHHEKKVSPAPQPLPNRVTMFNQDGRLSYVAHDGSRQTVPAKNVDRFALSPDGQQVAYTTFSNKHWVDRGLWIAKADGTDPHQVTMPCDGCQPGYGVAWSHDGSRLAYVVWPGKHKATQVRIRTLDTGQEENLRMPPGVDARGPSFSPDDRSLAVIMSGDSGDHADTFVVSQGTSSQFRLSPEYSQVQRPTWSADGQTVYFTATTSGDNTNDANATQDLYAIHADGTGFRQITNAAPGERFFGAVPYGNKFLISRARGDGPWVVGWLSADGGTFTPMKGPDEKPVLGTLAQLEH